MTETDNPRRWSELTWLWLALLAPVLVFSNGRWQLAIAAVAAIVLARLFLFSQPIVRGLLVLLPIQLGAYFIMWWGLIPVPGVLYFIIAGAYGICYFVPLAVDRMVSPRIGGFASTLVLPLSWYFVEILIQKLTPYGTWTSLGYTQAGHGAIVPVAAIIGVAGVAFVTVWIATVASWLVMTTSPTRHAITRTAIWVVAITVFSLVAQAPMPGDTREVTSVPVAAITPTDEGTQQLSREVQAVMWSDEITPEFLEHIDELVSQLNNDLLERSRAAAQAGAELIVWSETAAHALGEQESRLIEKGQALAREEGVYLFMGIGTWYPGRQPPLENKVVAITPEGEVAWHYHKARPIVGAESPLIPPGHNNLATLDAPFGRIGVVICHDHDFADYVAQAGRADVDLMLAPSADWPAIDDFHSRMGVMRTIENGFSLVRPAYVGLTTIASPYGQIMASAYDTELDSRILAGDAPLARRNTVYPHIRAYLPFLALIVLAGLLVVGRRTG